MFDSPHPYKPHELAAHGWRYHKPADPNAITLDPESPEQVEAVARRWAVNEGRDPDAIVHLPDGLPVKGWELDVEDVRPVLTALRDMKGGTG